MTDNHAERCARLASAYTPEDYPLDPLPDLPDDAPGFPPFSAFVPFLGWLLAALFAGAFIALAIP